jgi:hypothetical protein
MKRMIKSSIAGLIILLFSSLGAENSPKEHLYKVYMNHCTTPSDINEHIPTLRRLASECSSVVELGIRHVVSTWGILQGLSESSLPNRSYLGVDLMHPPMEKFKLAKELTQASGVQFDFLQANDMTIEIELVDMLFIDTLHTYCQLTAELEKFSPKVRKYIAMHDTSEPWGNRDGDDYFGDYSEYPAEYDRTKRGLWPAIQDFLQRHPEWSLQERHFNNHGFTVLRRVGS